MLVAVAIGAQILWPSPYSPNNSIDDSNAARPTQIEPNETAAWVTKLEKLAQDLRREQRRNVGLEQELIALRERIVRLESSRPPDADTTRYHATESRQKLAAQMTTRLQVMNTALDSESFDQGWATEAETNLVDVFRNEELAHLSPISTECRSSMCRVRFLIDGDGANRYEVAALREVIPLLPWQADSWLTVEDEHTGTGVLYLARQHHPLAE